MTRGRAANHLYLDLASAGTEPPTNTLAAIRPATSLEILHRILNAETAARSATTQHRLDTDPAQRLRAASTRYREAAATVPATAPVSVGAGDGPLPWLPPLPTTDDPAWADYLARRYELLQTLAADITVDTALPDTRWTIALQHKNPDLAHHLAVWRAAHDIPESDFRPCGPPVAGGADHQRLLLAHVESLVGPMLGPTDRWKPLLDDHAPDLTRDPYWPRLAAAFDRADNDGYDLPGRLPHLLTGLPQHHAGAELFYRLGSECEAALGTKDLAWQPSTEPPHVRHQDTEATHIDLIPSRSPAEKDHLDGRRPRRTTRSRKPDHSTVERCRTPMISRTHQPLDPSTLGPVVDLVTAAELLGIGRTAGYQLVRDNQFPVPVLRIGRLIRVPTAPLLQLLGLTT